MAYSFKSVTVRTDNSESGMAKINELWADIMQGRIPLGFIADGKPADGLFPLSSYGNYENGADGKYDLTVFCATAKFFDGLESGVSKGRYVKIDETGETVADCANKAWSEVWRLTASGKLNRAFTTDYESTIPAQYSKDGNAHCVLYIAVKGH